MKKRKKIYISFFLVLLLSAVSIFFIWNKYSDAEENKIIAEKEKQVDASNKWKDQGEVLGEEGQSAGDNFFKSTNFQSPQVSFGGDAVTYPGGSEQSAIEVSDVKSEVFTSKDKKSKKLFVSWRTNRAAKCQIEYEKAGGTGGKLFEEENFGFEHGVLLESIDVSSTYNFTVTARDRWSNEKASDKFAFYSGAPEVSFLDLLTGAFKDVFGWATK